jgi:pyruvate dehydrogenase E2 component (dihydrolipoamide acetyltransferase)
MPCPIVMPSFGMYTAEGTLVSWLQASGAAVREGEPVLEIETDKATQEVVAPITGFLHRVLEVGARLQEQMVIGYVLLDGEAPPSIDDAPAAPGTAAGPTTARVSIPTDFVKASPSARRLAQEHGIALKGVTATGPGGRVVESDILALVRPEGGQPNRGRAETVYQWRIRDRVPVSGMRKIIGERLKHSQNSSVSLTITREALAQNLMMARQKAKQNSTNSIPIDAYFVKWLGLALRERPELNAIISDDHMLLLDEVNIGFAVALPNGLSVPVIHEADRLEITEIAERMRHLADAARKGQLKSRDIEGGTSTISNLGVHGVDSFTPILNPPQSTILGIGRVLDRAVANNGRLEILPTVWLSLTFDHRIADGAAAAQLVDAIIKHLTAETAVTVS